MPERMTAEEFNKIRSTVAGHQPESEVLTQCRQMLQALGFYVVRLQQGMGSHRGLSDLVALKDGRTLWIECKASTGAPEALRAGGAGARRGVPAGAFTG